MRRTLEMADFWFRDRHPFGASPAWKELLHACERKHVVLRRLSIAILVVYGIVIARWSLKILPQLLRATLAFDFGTLARPDEPWEGIVANAIFLLAFVAMQRLFLLGLRKDAFQVPVSLRAVVPRLIFLVLLVLVLAYSFLATVVEMLDPRFELSIGWQLAAGSLCLAVLLWGGYGASRRINLYELLARYLFVLGALCIVVLVFAVPVDLILVLKDGGDTAIHWSLVFSSHLLVWLLVPSVAVLRVRAEQRMTGASVYLDIAGGGGRA